MVRVTDVRATPVEFPPGRYGRRRDPKRRRWVPVVAGLLIIAAGLAVTVKLYRQYGVPPYQVGAVAVTDVTATSVKISFEVRVPEGQGARCTVRTRNRAGVEVGRAVVDLPAAGPQARTLFGSVVLTATDQPFYSDVPGCGPAR
ncbi:hypothetical protein GCM10009681_16420 [Luedemannella helvata]|uniref:DUF4307 domain-containing protein n=1 Tax=Luedemannella helvata TaxID=349315 RepID=A0ABN2K0Z5_9ACTN